MSVESFAGGPSMISKYWLRSCWENLTFILTGPAFNLFHLANQKRGFKECLCHKTLSYHIKEGPNCQISASCVSQFHRITMSEAEAGFFACNKSNNWSKQRSHSYSCHPNFCPTQFSHFLLILDMVKYGKYNPDGGRPILPASAASHLRPCRW